jgi:metal-responsive CopG/Arc/MetJ family transcriptional regulator
MKRKFIDSMVEGLLQEFVTIDKKRQEMDKIARELKKRSDDIKKQIQSYIGEAEKVDTIYLVNIGRFSVSQILRHRDVNAYSYDFVEFVVANKD